MSDPAYNTLDRLLHRLALGVGPVAELAFDLDQRTVHSEPADIVEQRHVFVSGLARAGTTVLMRRFHATGLYRSLTYRDMPFVLAPNLWRRLAALSARRLEQVERAHGDRLLVDADSPESLDEVFWRTFAADEYLKADCLTPHTPDAATIEQYVRYVNAVLAADAAPPRRYLSKNNNNILRLGAIRQAFPNALILVPFRNPLHHARSLLRQHRRFAEMQEESSFTRSYMTWLAHHEFGLDHRPFLCGGRAPSPQGTDTLNYWLALWCDTYEWLEDAAPAAGAVFVCYEDLCADEAVWNRLADLTDISDGRGAGEAFTAGNQPSGASADADADPALLDRAHRLYDHLTAVARATLSRPVRRPTFTPERSSLDS